MSAARRMHRAQQAADRKRMARAAVTAARAQGCCCVVEVEVADREAWVRHDDWCPLLRSRSDSAGPDGPGPQLIIVPREWGIG